MIKVFLKCDIVQIIFFAEPEPDSQSWGYKGKEIGWFIYLVSQFLILRADRSCAPRRSRLERVQADMEVLLYLEYHDVLGGVIH